MNKEISILIGQLGVCLENEDDAEKLISILQNKLKYYQDKNGQNEELISKLKIAPSNLNTESQTIINRMSSIIEMLGVDSLDPSDIGCFILDKTNEQYLLNKKINVLKDKQSQCIKEIDNLKQETTNIEEEKRLAEEQINKFDSVSDVETNSLAKLVKKYQDTVDDLLEKNTWINNEEYNLLSIQEELKKLHKLRMKADELRNEVDAYKGLTPDLENARKQLNDIIKEYKIMLNDYKTLTK